MSFECIQTICTFRLPRNEWIVTHPGHPKVNLLGVLPLWGDCTFILADWGSYPVADLCYVALLEDFSLKPNYSKEGTFFHHHFFLHEIIYLDFKSVKLFAFSY